MFPAPAVAAAAAAAVAAAATAATEAAAAAASTSVIALRNAWTLRGFAGGPTQTPPLSRTPVSQKSLTRVTKSYLLALGTTQISSFFTKH